MWRIKRQSFHLTIRGQKPATFILFYRWFYFICFFLSKYLWIWILTVGIRKVPIIYDHISLRLLLLKWAYFLPVILNAYGNSQWRMQQLSNASFVNIKLLSLNHLMIFVLNSILFENNIVSNILVFVFS